MCGRDVHPARPCDDDLPGEPFRLRQAVRGSRERRDQLRIVRSRLRQGARLLQRDVSVDLRGRTDPMRLRLRRHDERCIQLRSLRDRLPDRPELHRGQVRVRRTPPSVRRRLHRPRERSGELRELR